MRRATPSLLSILAWLNVLDHVAGLLFAILGMRPGMALVPLAERLDYLAGFPLGWSLGWGTWMVCVVTLIAFLAAVEQRLPGSGLARLAVIVAAAGGAIDLFCDSTNIAVLPWLAAQESLPATTFLVVERLSSVGGLVIANGLYSVATLLVTLALRQVAGAGPVLFWSGLGVFAFGMVMSAGGLLQQVWLAEWATGPTIGLYCLWVVPVARLLDKQKPETR